MSTGDDKQEAKELQCTGMLSRYGMHQGQWEPRKAAPPCLGSLWKALHGRSPCEVRLKSESLRQAKGDGGQGTGCAKGNRNRTCGKSMQGPVGLKQVIGFYPQGNWEPVKNFTQGNKTIERFL